MKHITCDKCGMPTEAGTLRIANKLYDICTPCQNKILEGLHSKGEFIQDQQAQAILDQYRTNQFQLGKNGLLGNAY